MSGTSLSGYWVFKTIFWTAFAKLFHAPQIRLGAVLCFWSASCYIDGLVQDCSNSTADGFFKTTLCWINLSIFCKLSSLTMVIFPHMNHFHWGSPKCRWSYPDRISHWGRVTHIWVSKSDNGLSAPRHYLNQCWNIFYMSLKNKIQWNINRNSYVLNQENAFEFFVCEISAIWS